MWWCVGGGGGGFLTDYSSLVTPTKLFRFVLFCVVGWVVAICHLIKSYCGIVPILALIFLAIKVYIYIKSFARL